MTKQVDYLIKMESNNYRQCVVNGINKAIFHGWDYQHRMGIVEFEDGTVADVYVRNIKFLDGEKLFADYFWDEIENDE